MITLSCLAKKNQNLNPRKNRFSFELSGGFMNFLECVDCRKRLQVLFFMKAAGIILFTG